MSLQPKQRPTPAKSLAAPALGAFISLLSLPSTSWPLRVLKMTQGAKRPVGGPSSVLLSRTRAAPSMGESQENGFKKCTGVKAGVRATCIQQGGRGRRRRRGQLKQQAVPRLHCQNSSRQGLNYRLCANTLRGCRDQLPFFDEADRAKRKTEQGEKATYGDTRAFAGRNVLRLPLEPGELLPLTPVTAKAELRGPEECFGTQENELSIRDISMARKTGCLYARLCCSKPSTIRSLYVFRENDLSCLEKIILILGKKGRGGGRKRVLPEFGKYSCLFLLACGGEGSIMNHPSPIKTTTKILPEQEESFFKAHKSLLICPFLFMCLCISRSTSGKKTSLKKNPCYQRSDPRSLDSDEAACLQRCIWSILC